MFLQIDMSQNFALKETHCTLNKKIGVESSDIMRIDKEGVEKGREEFR